MVIEIQSRALQSLSLFWFQHTECGAGFKTQGFDTPNHGGHLFNITVFGFTPGCAHTESIGAGGFGCFRRLKHFLQVHQFISLNIGVVPRRLGAIATIFRTAASLNGQQGCQFHVTLGEISPVHLLGTKKQIIKWQSKQGFDRCYCPITLRNTCFGNRCRSCLNQGFFEDLTVGHKEIPKKVGISHKHNR